MKADIGERMQTPLWAPWRMEYITAEKPSGCFICEIIKENADAENLILLRGEFTLLLMNRYPYNSGHLLIAPYRHIGTYQKLTQEEHAEMASFTHLALQALQTLMKPDGFNIGINQGAAAGAGLEDHLHQHLIPRWNGDTNFMPVIGQTRVIPQLLSEQYSLLKEIIEPANAP
jgi:ATP adenylyltransferase